MRKTHSQPPSFHLKTGFSVPRLPNLFSITSNSSKDFFCNRQKVGVLSHLEKTSIAVPASSTSRTKHSQRTNIRSSSQTLSVIQEMRKTRLEILGGPPEQNQDTPDIVPQGVSLLNQISRKKELIRDVVSRKREMLLVQMKINDREEMIRKYIDIAAEKKDKLRKMEGRIIMDMCGFNDYLDANRNLLRDVMMQAENETKERIKLASKLEDLGEAKTSNLNESLKLLEKLNGLFLFKLFLDKIPPPGFLDEGEETQKQSKAASGLKSNGHWAISDISASKETRFDQPESGLADYTVEMLKRLKIELSVDLKKFLSDPVSTCSLFFRNPMDLIEVQRSIEEENIKLITSTQNERQKVEEKETAIAAMKANYEIERQELIQRKILWTQRTKRMRERIASQSLKDDSGHLQVQRFIADISARVAKLSDQLGVRQTGDIFADLTQIEQMIVRDTVRIADIDKKMLKKAEKHINDEKKMRFMMETQRKADELSAQKISKIRTQVVRRVPERRKVPRFFIRPKIAKQAPTSKVQEESSLDSLCFDGI